MAQEKRNQEKEKEKSNQAKQKKVPISPSESKEFTLTLASHEINGENENGMMDDLLETLKHGNTLDKKIRVERRRKNSITADQAIGLLEKLKSES